MKMSLLRGFICRSIGHFLKAGWNWNRMQMSICRSIGHFLKAGLNWNRVQMSILRGSIDMPYITDFHVEYISHPIILIFKKFKWNADVYTEVFNL